MKNPPTKRPGDNSYRGIWKMEKMVYIMCFISLFAAAAAVAITAAAAAGRASTRRKCLMPIRRKRKLPGTITATAETAGIRSPAMAKINPAPKNLL